MHPSLLEAVIRRTRGRACVVCPLKPTVLKLLAPLMSPVLADMFCACARVGHLPWRWAVSCISPIPKAQGGHAHMWRSPGIAVGTLPAKLYAAVLERRIQNWAEKAGLRTDGHGFWRGRSCAQAALVLRATIERQRRSGTPLFVCFVDFQKAFDTVPRHVLWSKLERASVVRVVPPRHTGIVHGCAYECSHK